MEIKNDPPRREEWLSDSQMIFILYLCVTVGNPAILLLLYLQPLTLLDYKSRQNMIDAIIRQLDETVAYIRKHYSHSPETGIVLGSGLGNLVSELKVEKEIDYKDMPHFPVS